MTKTTIFLSFLLLLFGHANSKSQFSLSHWQDPPSLSHSSHHCNWPEITCTNGTVAQLLLQNKNITQTVPSFICDLENKNITQTVPSFICDLENLTVIGLSNNFISQEFPKALSNCSMLEELDLLQNYLNGTIPVDTHSLSHLCCLNLGANSFYGNIPSSIGQLTELRTLQLFQCAFNGSFLREIGNLFKLESLQLAYNVNMTAAELPLSFIDLSDNKLTGSIFDDFGRLRNMTGPSLFFNQLSGKIPDSIGLLPSLGVLKVFSNNLSGTLPPDSGRYSMLEGFQVADNKLEGELPEHLCDNGRLVGVVAFNNNLTRVSSWRNLVVFEASSNLFTGTIPRELTSLPYLTTLFLDQNQLSGQIPLQLGLLKLTLLNLSSNHLIGRIPTQFENDAYASSFLNNLALCANKPSLNINSCNHSDHHKSSKVASKYLPLIISFVAVALLCLVVAMISIYRKGKHGLDSTWKFTIFQRVNFRESDILSGLTENNVIGSGGSGKVYRVVVNDSNNIVAVKEIRNNPRLEQKLEKEFHAEVKILGSIRHSNIVKLLCCMSNENSKLLVYEYSKNHSLDQWLHRKSRSSTTSSSVHHVVLDWPKRLQIAVGIGQGLYYMHHGCSPPIVHRDVKSSNILLDSEFNAKIAGFGRAKIFNQGELATMSVVPGSGDIAPEFDVYNFGLILLELATGREPNVGDEHTFLATWALNHILDKIPVVDALDKEVLEPGYLDEMSTIFILGIICTSTQPSMRPSMKEVLQILPLCTEFLPSSSVQITRMRQEVIRVFREKMLQEYDIAACRICFQNT